MCRHCISLQKYVPLVGWSLSFPSWIWHFFTLWYTEVTNANFVRYRNHKHEPWGCWQHNNYLIPDKIAPAIFHIGFLTRNLPHYSLIDFRHNPNMPKTGHNCAWSLSTSCTFILWRTLHFCYVFEGHNTRFLDHFSTLIFDGFLLHSRTQDWSQIVKTKLPSLVRTLYARFVPLTL